MNRLELIEKVKQELAEKALVVNSNGIVYLGPYMRKLLLTQARIDQKGRRGLSSRKARVKKKIIQKQFIILLEK